MCRFYKVFYEVFSELGFPLGVESIVGYAVSVARAVECDMEYWNSEGKSVRVVGYVACDSSSFS